MELSSAGGMQPSLEKCVHSKMQDIGGIQALEGRHNYCGVQQSHLVTMLVLVRGLAYAGRGRVISYGIYIHFDAREKFRCSGILNTAIRQVGSALL